MGMSQKLHSFSLEVRIIQAQNMQPVKPTKNLFTRLYLPIGNNQKIQLNGKKLVSPNTKHVSFWNEFFSLECSCPQEFLETLEHESLVLELRQSKVLRRIMGSHVVGKGEIPWKVILESPNMVFKEWVNMDLVSGSYYDNICEEATFKVPQVQVEIKIQMAYSDMKKNNNEKKRNKKWDECGCQHGHDQHAWCSAEDYEIFALGAILEAF
ncbi:hypothetical protein RJT34_09054 [Clitoria ternatea]|uniref:C2 domain-containing protein n=1 Tax=Clitoria ternatea TaxID=43366 RepID=A0AAN9K591_CLITE